MPGAGRSSTVSSRECTTRQDSAGGRSVHSRPVPTRQPPTRHPLRRSPRPRRSGGVQRGPRSALLRIAGAGGEIERALRPTRPDPGAEPHGTDPIVAVDDAELVELVDPAWTDALAAATRRLPSAGPRHLLAGGLPGPTAPHSSCRRGARRLGAFCFDSATPTVAGMGGCRPGELDVALTAAAGLWVASRWPTACAGPGAPCAGGMLGGYCFFNNAAIVADGCGARGG